MRNHWMRYVQVPQISFEDFPGISSGINVWQSILTELCGTIMTKLIYTQRQFQHNQQPDSISKTRKQEIYYKLKVCFIQPSLHQKYGKDSNNFFFRQDFNDSKNVAQLQKNYICYIKNKHIYPCILYIVHTIYFLERRLIASSIVIKMK